jgi:FkbH-like protein
VNFVGSLMSRLTGNADWDSATYRGLQRLVEQRWRKNGNNRLPDAFLLEVYNPRPETTRMELSFLPLAKDGAAKGLVRLGPSFVTTLIFPVGYSRHQIDASLLRPVLTSDGQFKISMIPEADSNARLVFLTADFVTFATKPATAETKKIKCVVWDLDNTLWDGILAEGDVVTPQPEVIRLLQHLDERGILLSIASKNDHASAWQKLEQLGISEYFLCPQIDWGPKSTGIQTIARRLNIGIDTFAFVDDNPFELDQVSHAVPEVVCIDARDMASLFSDSRFKGNVTAEASQRRQLYQEAMAREQASKECGSNYTGFLASCGIVLDVVPYTPEYLERVAELVQRTNQLNFSGHRYTRAELDKILATSHLEKFVLKCSDKYGIYGTVGFSIVEQGSGLVQVHDFMLSCRVQGKFIEQAFFHHLMEHHNSEGATKLWINFRDTARNKPARQVLESLGFRKCDAASDGLLEGEVHSSPDALRCDFIQVRCASGAIEATRAPRPVAAILRAQT